MKALACEFEAEALAAVFEGRWPERTDVQLRAHVSECMICSDVVAIAGAIEEAREDTRACAVIPDSGGVWWRAQWRARREAAKAAGRPITAAQAIAFGSSVGLLGACFGATSAWFQAGLRMVVSNASRFPSAQAVIASHGMLIFVTAGALLLVPAAVWAATLRE